MEYIGVHRGIFEREVCISVTPNLETVFGKPSYTKTDIVTKEIERQVGEKEKVNGVWKTFGDRRNGTKVGVPGVSPLFIKTVRRTTLVSLV